MARVSTVSTVHRRVYGAASYPRENDRKRLFAQFRQVQEFLLLAPNTDHADALALAERCRQAVAAMPMPIVGPVTASFGVGTYALDDDERLLMRRVDLALYTAKAQARNCVSGIRDIDRAELTSADERSRD